MSRPLGFRVVSMVHQPKSYPQRLADAARGQEVKAPEVKPKRVETEDQPVVFGKRKK